ncbi:DUF6998 domain-containing protein [Bacillus thuringiensis]|uniref:DUF6998 domain-containing protein n=1 Tax=Bacillus thuringiensis subsp. darmstadiensis TaxID=132264 RepID=A0A9X6PBW9_BACUD|nr:hypothetical protein [Bacillus thuringiensis]ADH06298.1 hypothetical protein BMB171_C1482 [Bacillus thuringiensis BMB171]ADH09530.1 hypothetical protein BMB171_C4722 [Bacillus thuringiensis BMB171]OTZ29028.1 hypothetical protein BK761_29280 [Bacillus thuringiensis serovar darmstadiensis]OTZ33805.1 hypothetical protein BK761_12610 [Bacillus thuringiensis serovar darmstadiensis]OTZ34075.1 hypothetical protein BK761_11415 [Bacillus thuringiensis serovar darmstadiensis]
MPSEIEYENMTIAECLGEYSKLMKVFKKRGATRTNNFVGDMGETATIEHYNNTDELPNLRLVEIGAKNIDAISDTNERYSIKATRTSMTSVFNGLNDPDSDMPQEQLFEYVIVVLFDEDVSLKAIYELNWETFMSLKKWNTSKRAYYLNVSNVLKRKAKIIYEQ